MCQRFLSSVTSPSQTTLCDECVQRVHTVCSTLSLQGSTAVLTAWCLTVGLARTLAVPDSRMFGEFNTNSTLSEGKPNHRHSYYLTSEEEEEEEEETFVGPLSLRLKSLSYSNIFLIQVCFNNGLL